MIVGRSESHAQVDQVVEGERLGHVLRDGGEPARRKLVERRFGGSLVVIGELDPGERRSEGDEAGCSGQGCLGELAGSSAARPCAVTDLEEGGNEGVGEVRLSCTTKLAIPPRGAEKLLVLLTRFVASRAWACQLLIQSGRPRRLGLETSVDESGGVLGSPATRPRRPPASRDLCSAWGNRGRHRTSA